MNNFLVDSAAMTVGMDTNVLLRLLVADNTAQVETARALIKRESDYGRRIVINLLVLLEAEWILRSRYQFSKEEILAAYTGLLESVEFFIEDSAAFERALSIWKSGDAEFPDCLIGARNASLGCRATVTHDPRALALAGFMAP